MSESIHIACHVQGAHTQEQLILSRDSDSQAVNVCINRPGINTVIVVRATSLLLAAQSVTTEPSNDFPDKS